MKETRTLEYKSELTNSFLKTVSAFSNFVTGKILFGIADDGTVTRENVTKSIVFNKDNFANLKKTGLMPGKLNSLEIAIVPDHLYVLADADQYIGYLEIE